MTERYICICNILLYSCLSFKNFIVVFLSGTIADPEHTLWGKSVLANWWYYAISKSTQPQIVLYKPKVTANSWSKTPALVESDGIHLLFFPYGPEKCKGQTKPSIDMY